jgi:hypothetical protein
LFLAAAHYRGGAADGARGGGGRRPQGWRAEKRAGPGAQEPERQGIVDAQRRRERRTAQRSAGEGGSGGAASLGAHGRRKATQEQGGGRDAGTCALWGGGSCDGHTAGRRKRMHGG